MLYDMLNKAPNAPFLQTEPAKSYRWRNFRRIRKPEFAAGFRQSSIFLQCDTVKVWMLFSLPLGVLTVTVPEVAPGGTTTWS